MSMAGMSRWWGPVFDAERVTRARRWQGYALRSLFVLGLLVGLVMVWVNQAKETGLVSVRQLAEVGMLAFRVLVILQITVVLAVAPAATAGAICLDKSRGSLAHVFVTDLSNREIVLGKLAARLLPVWGLLACALPVAAMATWLGGIDPTALIGLFLIALGLAVLGCAFALVLSVWAGRPHEVLTVVYSVWAVWLLSLPVLGVVLGTAPASGWPGLTNPFTLAFAPYDYPGTTSLVEPIVFALACGLVGAVCLAVAVAKIRVVACRSPRVRARRAGRFRWLLAPLPVRGGWFRGPQLDADPVLWREWHRNRPSRWSKFVWGGFGAISTAAGVGMILWEFLGVRRGPSTELPGLFLGLLATFGLLLVSASTASVLAEERSRGSLDVLISTPVSTRAILRAKWRGAFRRVPWLAFWPLVVGGVRVLHGEFGAVSAAIVCLVPVLIVVQGAALVSLGLALATWIKRTGQATAWTITAFVVAVVGWPIVGFFLPLMGLSQLQSPDDRLARFIVQFGLVLGSPFYNIALSLLVALIDQGSGMADDRDAALTVVAAWTLIYAVVAWGLFEATVRTFDRCIGRMPEKPTARPRPKPQHAPTARLDAARSLAAERS